ncbi:MAG: SDR family NAD(P)-dependent oxidoreductase [Burkholderiales bacterium]|nr:MAG: SDR family NAD(P)-dependent oxidoreductase [Burkholderiales bacterium]
MLRPATAAVPAARRQPARPWRLLAPLNEPVREWAGRRVWIVGASSGIGAALARQLGERGTRLALTARRVAPLRELLDRSRAAGLALPLDVTDAAAVADAAARIEAEWGGIDLTIWLAGSYAPMRAQDFDLAIARAMVDANLTGVLNGLAALIPMLRRQGHGGIALVSSVAGYRGLPKSLVYGPTKAALINLAESLYLDMHDDGVGVWLVNPGFVNTPMTAANDFRMPALIDPEDAARAIIDGFGAGRFEIHFPRRFTVIMRLLRLLPQRLYFHAVRRFTGL